MYNRIGGSTHDTLVDQRDIPVSAHVGTPKDYLQRLRQAAANAADNSERRQEYFENIFNLVADNRNLKTAWDYLKHHGGQSPGVDRMTFRDVPDRPIWPQNPLWQNLRELSGQIVDGSYRPARLLEVKIPKSGGFRTLEIPTVTDRTVGRAVLQAIQPYLDPGFDDRSYGGRPRRGPFDALANARQIALNEDRTIWVVADIRNAFPSVPRSRMLDILRQRIPNDQLVDLVEKLATNRKRRGIPQGAPLSPLLMNVYLDHFLDRPWHRTHPDLPMLRYVDDILVLCHSVEEAETALNSLHELLRPNSMLLKPSSGIIRLDQMEMATWLGFGIRLNPENDGLTFRLTERNWSRLKDRPASAHRVPDAVLRAPDILLGWLYSLGPAFDHENREAIVSRVISLANEQAFEELPSRTVLLEEWERGHTRWQYAINDVANPRGQTTTPPWSSTWEDEINEPEDADHCPFE